MLTEQEERELLHLSMRLDNLKRFEDLHLGSFRIIKETQEALHRLVWKSRNERNTK